VADATVRREGWIWGVPLAASPGDPFSVRTTRMVG
jgi:hypothetical protein